MSNIGKRVKIINGYAGDGQYGTIFEDCSDQYPHFFRVNLDGGGSCNPNIPASPDIPFSCKTYKDGKPRAQCEFVEDTFILPKEWCIISKSSDQDNILNKYARDHGASWWTDEYNHAKSFYMIIVDNKYVTSKSYKPECLELTFDQFKKYVLKEETIKEKFEERINFHVRYTPEFTEDLFNQLLEWSVNNSIGRSRGWTQDTFDNFKNSENYYFLFDNWGINSGTIIGLDKMTMCYGLDNNTQSCKKELTIKELKDLINYKIMNETRKIIGYKSPIDLYGNSVKKGTLFSKISENNKWYCPKGQERQSMPEEIVETWEPVYEKIKYKKGDWVICIGEENKSSFNGSTNPSSGWKKDLVFEVTKYGNDHILWGGLKSWGVYEDQVRKATPEEIENFNTVKFGQYKAEYNVKQENSVNFGCKVFTLDDLNAMKTTLLIQEKMDGLAEFNWTIERTKVDFNVEILNKLINGIKSSPDYVEDLPF